MSNTITGAKALVQGLIDLGCDTIFGLPGAAICPFYDEIKSSSITDVLVRAEQHAAHMASGYARASGKVGVCVATSGPGALNLITGLATAYMDSIPLVAITGQVKCSQLGSDAFQEADVTGSCEPFTKHSYIVSNVKDIPRVIKEAFHIAGTGRKGPVLIDIPEDVLRAKIENFSLCKDVNIIGYKPTYEPHPNQVKKVAELLNKAKKPLLVVGGGVYMSKAREIVRAFQEKINIPAVTTMMGKGIIAHRHPLYLGMIGSHGRGAANKALREADCILILGARVGDRSVSDPSVLRSNAKIIHIDIDPAEIGKNVAVDVPVVADCTCAVNALNEHEITLNCDDWRDTIKEYKQKCLPKSTKELNHCCPFEFMRTLTENSDIDAIVTADVGQNQIWACNNYDAKDGLFLTSGGMGTMGYSIPAALGASMADKNRQVISITGDGAFSMAISELATIKQQNAPVKMVVLENKRLGMVYELQTKFYGARHEATLLDGDPDFTLLAKAYGIESFYAKNNDEAKEGIKKMLANKNEPFLLVLSVSPETPTL